MLEERGLIGERLDRAGDGLQLQLAVEVLVAGAKVEDEGEEGGILVIAQAIDGRGRA